MGVSREDSPVVQKPHLHTHIPPPNTFTPPYRIKLTPQEQLHPCITRNCGSSNQLSILLFVFNIKLCFRWFKPAFGGAILVFPCFQSDCSASSQHLTCNPLSSLTVALNVSPVIWVEVKEVWKKSKFDMRVMLVFPLPALTPFAPPPLLISSASVWGPHSQRSH